MSKTGRSGRPADPVRLRERLAPYRRAFELTGDGPSFLQDFGPLGGDPNPPDMLFIDSAGQQTAKNNADLMVRRRRYEALPPRPRRDGALIPCRHTHQPVEGETGPQCVAAGRWSPSLTPNADGGCGG